MGAKSSLFNKQPTRLNRVFQWKITTILHEENEGMNCEIIFLLNNLLICCLNCPFCYSNAYMRVPLQEPHLQTYKAARKTRQG